MNKKELIEKLYDNQIKKDDVIVEKIEHDEKLYILNNEFDYWYYGGDEVISLYFLKEDNYEYEIIKLEDFKKIQKEKEKKEKIQKLKEELKWLKN